MRIFVLAAGAAATLAGMPQSTAAQSRWGPAQIAYCSASAPEGECRAETIAALLLKLDLPAAEVLAAEGYSGVRIFHYDGFRNIWPAVTALSRPVTEYRREGYVEARTIHADEHVATMTRPIWEGGWRRLDAVVAVAKDRPAPAPEPVWDPASGHPPSPPPCLDPPGDIVEVIADGQVTRWSPSACAADPTFREVAAIWEMVAAAFPVCGHLPIERYGYSIGRLRACLLLDGPDPVAAIPVLEAVRIGVEGHLTAPVDATLSDPDVRLIVGDASPIIGATAIDSALRGGVLRPRSIRLLRFSGDGNQVVVHGLLTAIPPAEFSVLQFSQTWATSTDGAVRLMEWRVPAEPDRGSD